MKKLLKYFFAILILVIHLSCEDDLNPFVKGEDVFILNCVLKNDRPNQTAFLSKNYFVDNFDPKSDTNNHSIENAYIRIFFDDSVKIFEDTLINKNINSDQKITSYFNNNFFTKPDTEYELEAILSDGRKLRATTKTPKKVSFNGDSDRIIPPEEKDNVTILWDDNQRLYTAARFLIVYFKNENGISIKHQKEVPRKYIYENSQYIPYFPEPSYSDEINVEMSTFNKAMEEISLGDENKGNYTIFSFILEILIYDQNLTAYYASKAELDEGFSVTTSENDYTNIIGGRGIFGTFIKQRFAIKFAQDYIKSFGYKPGLTENLN
ncbi:MAG: hypothetical protein IPM32_17650 [Ignavibacteriae bacterium]|nr:hypothetical protein [Ignavibacteriota bacterium]